MLNKILLQYTLLTFFLCLVTLVQAQVLNISNETIVHDNMSRNAVKVTIAPDSKDVKKEFRDYMDDKYGVEVEGIGFLKNKDVLYTEPQIISDIASQNIKLFAKIIEIGNQTEMYVFGQFDNNNQISSTTSYGAYAGMKDMTVDFLNTLLPDYYKEIVEEQTDLVADLEDNRTDMRKKIAKNKEKIKALTKENQELEQKLASTEVKLEKNIDELSKKRKNLKEVNEKLEIEQEK